MFVVVIWWRSMRYKPALRHPRMGPMNGYPSEHGGFKQSTGCIHSGDTNQIHFKLEIPLKYPPEILKASVIAAMEGEVKTHDFNPNAVRLSKSLGDATGLTNIGFHLLSIQPGLDSTAYHRHMYEDECVYILSGHGEAVIDELRYDVAAGDFLGFAKQGPAHILTNSGTVPLVCLVTGQRLEQDVCDYPHKNTRLFINGKREDLVELQHIVPLS